MILLLCASFYLVLFVLFFIIHVFSSMFVACWPFATYQNLRSRFGIERYAYTESHIAQIPCVGYVAYVCMYVIKLLPNHWTDLHKNYTSK